MRFAPTRDYRPDIDGLRAIAVLAVVFFHAELPYFHGGFVGVDIFFVISGYLITRNILSDHEANQFSYGRFYLSRCKRLLPAFLVAVLFTFALGFLILSPIHFLELGKTTINAVLSLSNIFFWQDADYFATDSQYIPLLHTWSLSVEEQFYAIWPLFLLTCLGFVSGAGLPWILLAVGCASLAGAIWVAPVDNAAGFYLMPFRMFEFCIGAACLWFEKKRKVGTVTGEIAALIGYVAIGISIFGFTVNTPFPSYYALLPCIGTALLIVYGQERFCGALLRNRVAVSLGLISYSLYLFHWPLLVYGRYAKFDALSALETTVIILLSIALAALCYRFVEQPFRKLKLGTKSLSAQGLVVGSLSAALLTVFLGAHAWGGKGWKFRIDRDARRVISLTSIDVYSPCRQPGPELRAEGFRCVFGSAQNEKKIEVVLLGDSHAEHWLPGLDQVLKENGIRAIYAGDGGSLPFIIGKSMTVDGPASLSYTKPFEFIRRNKPKIVVISGRWAASAHVTRPDGGALWYSLESARNLSPAASQSAMKTAAKATLEHLKETGTKVLVLGQVPLVGLDLVACLSRPKFVGIFSQNRNCNGFTSKQVRNRDEVMRVAFEGMLKDFPNAQYVEIVDKMCGPEFCDNRAGKTALYRDDDHLSFHGSIVLTERYVREPLTRLLRMP